DAGIADNTLVVYTSDNGSFMYRLDDKDAPDHVSNETIQAYRADHHTANGPLRGTKADVWEAGHRVPFFVRWPGKVKPDSKCDETICHTDLFATFAEAAGAKLEDDHAEDSFSILPLTAGKDWATPRAPVINHSSAGMFAIRDGKWKLVAGNGSGGRQQPRGKPFGKPYQLFDLNSDLGETTNVAENNPEVVNRLEKQLERIRAAGRSR
ncbi:MAG: sulfatase-like hydrolase/transferase, partial [Pirellulales bacterium]|nr:sulfatase-like hydrolase/transferase [Pirellulales bacterium]